MSSSVNRRLLKARTDTSNIYNKNDNSENVEHICIRNKRKVECSVTPPSNKISVKEDWKTPTRDNSNMPTKFSANDRLKKYRTSLDNRKNEVIKVHQVLASPISSSSPKSNNNINESVSTNTKCKGILGKRSLTADEDKDQSNLDLVSPIKKRKSNESSNTLVNQNQNDNSNNCVKETYDMDWSPIDEDQVVSNIQKIREKWKENPSLVSAPCTSEVNPLTISDINAKEMSLYIVVDTNIFISHLSLVKDMLCPDYKRSKLIVYIPWMVLQELDYFKDGRVGSSAMLNAAKRAVKFINQNLMEKQDFLKGQTVQEALLQKESSNPDDHILFCCIHLAESGKPVILLSNDTNLRNKAIMSKISSYGPKDILTKIEKSVNLSSCENAEKIPKINELFTNMCIEIIKSEMEKSYGSALYQLIKKPPWDLKTCLRYIKRFWNPVFSLIISQRQCLKIVEDLLKFLETCDDISAQKNMDEFVKLCLSVCIYFKNCLNIYQETVVSCINNMQQVLR